MEVSKKPAGRLDFPEDGGDVISKVVIQVPDPGELDRDFVAALCFPPAPEQLIHTYSTDIKSMRLW